MGSRRSLFLALALLIPGLTGCRCCCCFERYGDVIDHIKDYPILFDQWYHPRLDISRAGKPDWCGPINRHLAPCRCDCVNEWTCYDECWLYPPRHPYAFPGNAFAQPALPEPPLLSEPYSSEFVPPEPQPVPPAPTPDPPEN